MFVVQPGANGTVEWGGDDTVAAASALENPYGFTGQRYDAETGLLFYKARYYDPQLGVFLSRDPVGFWDDANNLGNPYAYVGNNPVMNTDPTGIYCYQVWKKWCRDQNARDAAPPLSGRVRRGGSSLDPTALA